MRRLRLLWVVTLFAGCSFLTSYEQDGQPCDKAEPNPALSCLSDAGYTCVAGFCRKADGGTKPDGGLDGGSDAGRSDGGPDAGRADAGETDGGDGG